METELTGFFRLIDVHVVTNVMKCSRNISLARDHSLSSFFEIVIYGDPGGGILDLSSVNPYFADKRYFKDLGFSKDDFHAITWLTSWALSGTHEHELPDCNKSEARESVPARYVYHLP